jgi:hypothetical protein
VLEANLSGRYESEKWNTGLAKANVHDSEDTAMEAMHGYYRMTEDKAPYVQSPEAKMRATRRSRIGTGKFDPLINLAYRPRDNAAVYMALHDITMQQVLKLPPKGDGTVNGMCCPARLPRPNSAGTETQLSGMSLAKSASQPALSRVSGASGSRVGRSQLSRTASSAGGLSRLEILQKALGEDQAREPSVAA